MYRAILEAEPRHSTANYCMGMLFLQLQRPSEGLANLLVALASDPQIPDYWLGYLEALLLAGKIEEAGETLARARQHGLCGPPVEEFAARLRVKSPPASNCAASRAAAALESQMRDHLEAKQFVHARAVACELIERFPERGLGWKMVGALLAAEGRLDEALNALQEAARRLPKDAEALCNLGVMYARLKRLEEAESCLQQAIAVDPGFNDSYPHLGFVQASLEKFPQAEAAFRRAVADAKSGDNAQQDMRHSSLAFLLTHNPAVHAAQLFDEHRAIGRWLEGAVGSHSLRHSNDTQPERRLMIGIVSGDLNSHAIANFIEPVLAHLRYCTDLQLHAFSNNEIEDEVSGRLRQSFAHWHRVSALKDRELVEMVKADAIDILIDLSGHTSFNRLRAFAMKAAPIQVSWLGYPGTTGLRAMDYYLADPHFLPPGRFEESFSEKIVYLPAAWTFSPHADSPDIQVLPALEAGFMTFGSFNRVGKLNPFTVRLWSRLLRAIPNSILVMAGIPLDERRHALAALFEAEGISGQRLAFFPRSDMRTYLELHGQVDICLDTFPYTGGTTTNHALWMGVPTLTLAGGTAASRQCAANLGHLGLEGFIAADVDDFVRKGLQWSSDVAALAELRSGLRERWLAAPLRRPETIAAGIGAALRHMWRLRCRNLPPQSFSVDASNQVSP